MVQSRPCLSMEGGCYMAREDATVARSATHLSAASVLSSSRGSGGGACYALAPRCAAASP
eukprot:CAMPEP_0118907780 /NCGR_PEP_ID=MMETSP1166-20130328/11080_1 /TAXON_ID=1104430 /ORGANISM="Chrysoreinhardia sp, Strain CCMP3193" /LENGTH=59 /DNA_ID=CAMNT_0006847155 /DNA_START=61 /DNA_END=237 /DNA_ORIENTATION=+